MVMKSPLLSFVLSSVVVAWGTCPPAMRHAHEGGEDTSHDHVAAVDHGEHGHAHPSEIPQQGAGGTATSTMDECVVHLHWVLWGFHFSLPVSPDTGDPDQLASFDSEMVRLVDDLPTFRQGEQRGVTADLPVSPELVARVVCLMPSPPRWINSIASLPLCDRARFERSGVLLV
ncbi:MAG: hypothetical protein ACYC0X_24435 [Pirellulaceae bacterium]